MNPRIVRAVVSFVVIGGGVGYLLYSTSGNALEYYKHVDEIAGTRAEWQGKPMQIHGFVVPGSIQKRFDRDSNRLEYKFQQVNCGKEIEVRYAGTVPDTFKDGAEVVVKGAFHGEAFDSTEVMAKCPSKYEAQGGAPKEMPMCSRGKAN